MLAEPAVVAVALVVAAGGLGRLGVGAAQVATARRPETPTSRPVRFWGSDRVATILDAAGWSMSPDVAVAFVVTGALSAGAGVGLISRSLIGTVASAALVIAAAVFAAWTQRHRRDRLVGAALPIVVEEVARSMRGGASFHQSLNDARSIGGPVATQLDVVANQLAHGVRLSTALESWMQRQPLPAIRLFCGALALTVQSGTGDGSGFEGLAQSLRDKAAVDQEVTALVAQAKLSGLVVAVLPLGFLAFSFVADQDSIEFLFHTTAGQICLVVALVLDLIGYGWMQQLAKSVAQ